MWKVSENMSEELLLAGNLRVMEEIKPSPSNFPYTLYEKAILSGNNAKPAVLREVYRRLTGMAIIIT